MTASVMLGLAIQFMALWVVHVAIRGHWFRRIGAIFLLMAVLEHGITEVMQWMSPGRNEYRYMVSQGAIDDWVILVSIALLTFAISYAIVIRRSPLRDKPVGDARGYVAGLKIRWLALACAPLVVATFQGRGALQPVAPGQEASRDNYAISGLAGQYLVLLVALIGVVIMARYGSRWTLLLIACQVVAVSAIGARSAIVMTAVLTLFGAAMCGIRPTRRQVVVGGMLVAIVGAGISASRAVDGRTAFLEGSGGGQRLSTLTDGISALSNGNAGNAVLGDLVYRFDCNSYGALILQGLDADTAPVGYATIVNNALLAVPSFLNPHKLSTSLVDRNEEAYVDERFGLDIYQDWLPGVFGTLVSYWGSFGLILIALLMGMLFAAADRTIRKAAKPGRLIIALGLVQCAMLYEVGPSAYFVWFRGAVTIALLVLVLRFLKPVLPFIRKLGVTTSASRSEPGSQPVTPPRSRTADPSGRADARPLVESA